MILTSPLIITARLCPGVRIGDTFISYEGGQFVFDFPDGSEYATDSYSPGCGVKDMRDVFEDLICFLDTAADARMWRVREGRAEIHRDSGETLFPPHVVDWAYANKQEIEDLWCDLRSDEDA